MKSTVSNPSESFQALPSAMADCLLDWYDKNRRILPWREDPAPYHVWISEIMLQQTRVDTVIPYYHRFLKELPDVQSLAEAKEERLLKLWEGLGYYSRVRNMQKAAITIVSDYGGVIPSDPDELKKLKGIGAYTAAAIASIAYQVPVPSVDGNLLRVYARLTAYRESIQTTAAKHEIEKAFSDVLSKDRPGDMNQALMDIGATICLPNGAPLCSKCPFNGFCEARRLGIEQEIPKAKEKTEKPSETLTVFLICSKSTVLVRKRPDTGLLAGLFEFPNVTGTLSKSEAETFCHSLGLNPKTIKPLKPARHVFSHLIWNMTAYEAVLETDDIPALPDHYLFISLSAVEKDIAIPSAFSAYTKLLTTKNSPA